MSAAIGVSNSEANGVQPTRAPAWWGMVLFCVTEATLFVYFLGSWFYLRGTITSFAAEGGRHPALGIPVALTLLLGASSASVVWAERGIRRGDARRLSVGLVVTLALGAAFLALQAFEYARETHMPQTDAYWSTYYTITGFHGAHVLLGWLMLAFTLLRNARGHFSARRHLAVQNVGLYWHTVDGVWLVIVLALYVAPWLW